MRPSPRERRAYVRSAVMLIQARTYVQKGWSVIPLAPKDKVPLVPWAKFQTHRATDLQVRVWWKTWPTANVGVVTGAISGLVVVDLDGTEGMESLSKFPPTTTVKTGRGQHLYFQHPGGLVPARIGVLPHVDIRGDGGYVVAPPSIHPTGAQYVWLGDTSLVPLPEWLMSTPMNGGSNGSTKAPQDKPTLLQIVPEGQRRNYPWRIGRAARHWGAEADDLRDLLTRENLTRCSPPLGDQEMKHLIHQVITAKDRGVL